MYVTPKGSQQGSAWLTRWQSQSRTQDTGHTGGGRTPKLEREKAQPVANPDPVASAIQRSCNEIVVLCQLFRIFEILTPLLRNCFKVELKNELPAGTQSVLYSLHYKGAFNCGFFKEVTDSPDSKEMIFGNHNRSVKASNNPSSFSSSLF